MGTLVHAFLEWMADYLQSGCEKLYLQISLQDEVTLDICIRLFPNST